MKLCVSSQGPDLASHVDCGFGRARFFIIHEEETGTFDVVDNKENKEAPRGAGIKAATAVARAGCDWVICRHIGQDALAVLKDAGVRVAAVVSGKVSDVFRMFREGELEEIDHALS